MTWRHSILLAFAITAAVFPGNATQYLEVITDPWEVHLEKADFVGVIECEVAGPMISKYRVIEVWKGDPKQKSILVRAPLRDQYKGIDPPNCGVIGVVALNSPSNIATLELTELEIQILSQRLQMTTDFISESFLFNFRFLETEKSNASSFSKSDDDILSDEALKRMRTRSKEFLSLPTEKRTIQIIQGSLGGSIAEYEHFKKENKELRKPLADIKVVAEKIKRSKTLAQVVEVIASRVSEQTEFVFERAIHYGGKPAYEAFKKHPKFSHLEDTNDEVKASANKEKNQKLNTTPTNDELAKAERELAIINFSALGFSDNKAMILLTKHRPELIADKLVSFERPQVTHNAHKLMLELASYENIRNFGMYCGTNRRHCLEQLLEANDPIIRTGAAVYLCSEDLEKGMKALEECAKLPDAAGTWAAVTLACRGQKSAIPRALRVFAISRNSYQPELQSVWDKPGQLKSLLSNSAKASGVPQPTAPYDVWWKKYGDKITLHDPWLAEMDRLKID